MVVKPSLQSIGVQWFGGDQEMERVAVNYGDAAGMVPSRDLRRRRVFGILSAMGLMSATALIGAERFSNSFVTVEGDGVRIADDGSIHFPNAKSPVAVEVNARPGWKVNGRKSLSLVRSPGDNRSLSVTSELGEDSDHVPLEDCQFDSVVSNAHVAPPAISIEGSERLIYMYALPGSNVLVSASASCETLSNGVHEVTTTWLPCPVCHAAHDPAEEKSLEDVAPGAQIWTASAAGVATIRHEKQHRQTGLDWLPGGAWYMKLDTDGDELPDDWED